MDNGMNQEATVEQQKIHDLLMAKLETMPVVPQNEYAKRSLPEEFVSRIEKHNVHLKSIIDWIDGTVFCTDNHDYWVDSMILNNTEYALYVVKAVGGDPSSQDHNYYGWLICCTYSQKWEKIKKKVNAVTKSSDKTRIWRSMNIMEIQQDHIIRKCPDGFTFKITRLVLTKEFLMNLSEEMGHMIDDLKRFSKEKYKEVQ